MPKGQGQGAAAQAVYALTFPLGQSLESTAMTHARRRQLTIGEYAAATQLTAKALRLYDEQGLIKPSVVDSATGYRYYHADQVAKGRLVRALRDMSLSLAQVAQVLAMSPGSQPALLREFLRDAEHRLARERTAYQTALLMLRSRAPSQELAVAELSSEQQRVALFNFSTNRREFVEQALLQISTHVGRLQSDGYNVFDACAIALIEPLTDDDAQVELAIPIDINASSGNLTTRMISARHYATVPAPPSSFLEGIAPSIDALFDWFDRKGAQAVGCPEVVLRTGDKELEASVRWAFTADESS